MVSVSVIIPVFNSEEWIDECLKSVLSQTLHDIEVICIDDGSSDRSLEILHRYAIHDKRIIVVRSKHLGTGAIRNMALDCAKGRYVAFMDSDDMYPDSSVLECLVDAADKNQVDIAGGYSFGFFDKNDNWSTGKPGYGCWTGDEGLVEFCDFQSPYAFQCYLFSRVIIEKYHLRFPAITRFEDPVFFVNFMLKSNRFYAVNRCVYLYRDQHKIVDWSRDHHSFRKELLRGGRILIRIANENGLLILRRNVMTEVIGGISDYSCYRDVKKELREFIRELKVNGLTVQDLKWLAHWLVRESNPLLRVLVVMNELGWNGVWQLLK